MSRCKTAVFQVRAEALDTCLEAIRAFVAHAQTKEPGTLMYRSLQSVDDPTRFVHVMAFADEAAEKAHATSDAVRRFTDVLYPNTVDGVAFTTYREVTPG